MQKRQHIHQSKNRCHKFKNKCPRFVKQDSRNHGRCHSFPPTTCACPVPTPAIRRRPRFLAESECSVAPESQPGIPHNTRTSRSTASRTRSANARSTMLQRERKNPSTVTLQKRATPAPPLDTAIRLPFATDSSKTTLTPTATRSSTCFFSAAVVIALRRRCRKALWPNRSSRHLYSSVSLLVQWFSVAGSPIGQHSFLPRFNPMLDRRYPDHIAGPSTVAMRVEPMCFRLFEISLRAGTCGCQRVAALRTAK